MQNLFEDLAATGVARADLQIAWEFTTSSLEYTTGWMVAMRDDAKTRVPATGPTYRIVSIEDEFNGKYVGVHAPVALCSQARALS